MLTHLHHLVLQKISQAQLFYFNSLANFYFREAVLCSVKHDCENVMFHWFQEKNTLAISLYLMLANLAYCTDEPREWKLTKKKQKKVKDDEFDVCLIMEMVYL